MYDNIALLHILQDAGCEHPGPNLRAISHDSEFGYLMITSTSNISLLLLNAQFESLSLGASHATGPSLAGHPQSPLPLHRDSTLLEPEPVFSINVGNHMSPSLSPVLVENLVSGSPLGFWLSSQILPLRTCPIEQCLSNRTTLALSVSATSIITMAL